MMSRRDAGRWAAGLVLLVLLALGVMLLGRHAPPFREVSDGAVLEIYTLEALRGSLRVGPYSRFGFHHPGPVFFYLEAPWYWLSGRHTVGMQVGALLINVAAFAAIAWTALKYGPRSMAVALAIVLSWYVYRTGDLIVSVWNPHVVILPLVAFVVTAAAMAATGRRAMLVSMVLIGSFLVQTHVAMASVVVCLGTVAVAVQGRSVRRAVIPAGGLALVLWLPSLIEQMSRTPGNMTRIISFFLTSSSPGQRLGTAAAGWSDALTSVFRRPFAVAMGFDFHPAETRSPLVWAVVQVIALGLATAAERRRAHDFAAWLAAMSAVTAVIALMAITQIREQIVDHEIFWISALGALNAAVIAGALASSRRPGRAVAAMVCAAACVVVIGVGAVGIGHALERTRTVDDHSVDVLTEAVQQALQDAGARRPLFHIEPAIWPVAAGALLRLRKSGLAFAVEPEWTNMFGEAFAANGREDIELTIAGSPRQPRLISE